MDRAGTFEDRLLAELVPLVGSVPPAPAAVPRPRVVRRTGRPAAGLPLRPPPRRIAFLVSVVLILLIGVTAGVAVWPRRLATPAYALDERPDGTLALTVNDRSDPAGLQRALAEHHVRAAVLTVDPAVPCSEQARSVPAPGAVQGRPDHPDMLMIRPALLPPDGMVLLGLSRVPAAGDRTVGPGSRNGGDAGGAGPATTGRAPGHDSAVVFFTVIRGPAPRCFPGVGPALPAPTS